MPGPWNTVPFPSPTDIKDGTIGAQVFTECSSEKCVTAQRNLILGSDSISRKCTLVKQKEANRNVAAGVAAGAAAVAAAALTVAVTASATAVIPFFGWLVTTTAWAAFGIAALVSAIATGALVAAQSQVDDAYRQLTNAQDNFANISNDVMTNCPPQCWGDLTMPSCSGG